MHLTSIEQAGLLVALAEARAEAIVSINLEGIITFWNGEAERLFGYPAADAIGQSIGLIAPPAADADPREWWRQMRADDELHDRPAVCPRRQGDLVSVLLTLSPMRGAAGDVIGTALMARLLDSPAFDPVAQRLSGIVESSDDAIVSKDAHGIVKSWNRAAEAMFGYNAQEMIGQSIRRIIPDDRQAEEDQVLGAILRGDKVEHFETIRRKKDGSMLPVSLTVSPVRDHRGVVVGASKIARDISERRRSEKERECLLTLTREHAALTDRLSEIGKAVASTLDPTTIAQAVTDAATNLTTAEFGAFFFTVTDESGEAHTLHTVSGAPREAFSRVPRPLDTRLFAPPFDGTGLVRSDDIAQDPRYDHPPPYYGLPDGQVPVRSYLAVPVLSRSGETLGGLFFGHSRVGQFTTIHEHLAISLATWASVALENAHLYARVHSANRVKDEFLATLSHELRTPLNAIVGYARMLNRGMLADAQYARAIATIERNADSLTRIVEDVLDIARIVSGKVRLDVQTIDVPRVVQDAVEAIMPAANAKQIRLDKVIDPNAGPVSGDPDRLQQVTWNLLTNAVKFTPRGGTVQVRVGRVNSHVEISVSDSGAGIGAAFLPHIFEPFRQADASTRREHGGLGLGLSIARQLVEMQGGTIQALSAGAGKGATFRVLLPLMIVQPETSPGARVHPRNGADEGFRALPSLEHLRLLAVDDDRDALEMVRHMLEAAGAEVVTSSSAMDALEQLRTIRPDVIIADLGMPHVDGFEFIARVREHPDARIRMVPAAALTAYVRSHDRARALQSGFQMHLAKPIDPTELVTAVAALARRTP